MKKWICAVLCVLLVLALAGCGAEKKVDTAFPTGQVTFGMTLPGFAEAIGAEDVKGNPGQLSYSEIGMKKPEVLGLSMVKDDAGEYYKVMCYFYGDPAAGQVGSLDRAGTFRQLQVSVLCEDMEAYLTSLFGEPEDAANACGKVWNCLSESNEVLYELYFVDTQQDFDGLRAYHLVLCDSLY
ncbi:MAG: hypothetical protein IKU17_03495 [Clostridia bacterium]|nr:hypothetical protein [Clostridia bacterium]